MKAVILAGGLGTRMGRETASRPKPLVEVGGHPILWHILKSYQAQGIVDFVVCTGYAGHLIAEYMKRARSEGWHAEVVDTGETTATGGRLRRVRDRLGDDTFCMTYGDGVSDVNIAEVVALHARQRALVTVTTVQPRLPFGLVTLADDGERVTEFKEKPRLEGMWVNAGFFVMEPRSLDYVTSDDEPWEGQPMTRLAHDGQLAAYKHGGFWQCMDAPRDRECLERLWRHGGAPWKVW